MRDQELIVGFNRCITFGNHGHDKGFIGNEPIKEKIQAEPYHNYLMRHEMQDEAMQALAYLQYKGEHVRIRFRNALFSVLTELRRTL